LRSRLHFRCWPVTSLAAMQQLVGSWGHSGRGLSALLAELHKPQRARPGRRPMTPEPRKRRAAARLTAWKRRRWLARLDRALSMADRRTVRFYVLPRDTALLYVTDRGRTPNPGPAPPPRLPGLRRAAHPPCLGSPSAPSETRPPDP
jgi:hypothetical protein